ncbi:MAG: aspartate aminotransferase family protein [Bacteroidota bacterium]
MKKQRDWRDEAEQVLIRYCGEFSPYLIEKAQGSYIYSTEGKAILDFTSGQMCSVFGHNHPKIMAALQKSGDRALHLLSMMLSPEVIELAEKLSAILPEGLDRCLFLNTGSESNEAALRMAKLVTGGFEILAISGSWHGMTAGAQSYTYSKTRQGYGPEIPGSRMLPAPYAYRCPIRHCQGSCDQSCLEVGMQMVDQESVGAYAALIAEPVLSAAGIIELSPAYVKRLKELCDERGLKLIFDEAQTAFGRLGYHFAFEEYEVVPDFLALSKTMGGGLPLSATITSKEIEEACFEKGFVYVTSHISDPLPALVGLATLDILLNENMAERALANGKYLKDSLIELQKKHECIGDVRGKGLLLGLEIVRDRAQKTPAPELGEQIADRCLELGLSMNIVRVKGFGGVFRIAPPLSITPEEIDLGVAILDQAIQEVMEK